MKNPSTSKTNAERISPLIVQIQEHVIKKKKDSLKWLKTVNYKFSDRRESKFISSLKHVPEKIVSK